MQHVKLGRSGLEVSRICIGGNSWGAKGNRTWRAFDAAESRPLIRHALDKGINFFDTADVYNAGASETILGAALLDYARREDVVIATKVGIRMGEGPNRAGLGRKHVMASIDASLKRLGTDHVDLYIIHRYDPATPVDEIMETLADVVRAGKALHIGASSMWPWQLARLQTYAAAKGLPRFVAMQNLWSLLYREEEREMVPLCREEGIALTPYSPLARGMLSGTRRREGGGDTERAQADKGAEVYRSEQDFAIVDAAVEVAHARGVTPSRVALAWLLAQPGMAAPVIGATRPEYIDDAVAAVELTLTAEEAAALEAPYRPRPAMGI
jgi:aryl-alcohol dehydrogenase (NADP+)